MCETPGVNVECTPLDDGTTFLCVCEATDTIRVAGAAGAANVPGGPFTPPTFYDTDQRIIAATCVDDDTFDIIPDITDPTPPAVASGIQFIACDDS